MVKAYIDDSMADGRVLVFGGLIASTERWKAFEISWQQCLDHANRKVFKTKNVVRAGRVGKRDHAERHYHTVREHAQGGICFVVPIAHLEKAVARYGLTGTAAAKPYFWAFKGVINGLAQNQREWGLTEPVDFIFDNRPAKERNDVLEGWEIHRDTVPDEVRSIMGNPPVFADDKDVLPFQAADMWAWSCRKTWLDNGGTIPQDSYPIQWGKVGDIPQMILQWTPEDIFQELSRVAEWRAAT